ncbi:MAG: sulfotransferase [Caulobacteraceae bacterium]
MTATTSEPVGDLAVALAHAARLLRGRPVMAEAQCREILKVVPGDPRALRLLAAALREQGDAAGALAIIVPLSAAAPTWAPAALELGLTLGALGRSAEAREALRRAVRLDPRLPHGWRALGDELHLAGDEAGADAAYARHLATSAEDPALLEAGAALVEGRLAAAEHALRPHLEAHPTDVAALRMLAEVGGRLGRYEDAEALLARCVALAPGFETARYNLATVLYRQTKAAQTLEQLEPLLARAPRNPAYRNLKCAALGLIGEYEAAIAGYEDLLSTHPAQPKAWISYGHALKTVGRTGEAVAAYRRSLALAPGLGEAWWSLANLKTLRFTPQDVSAMEAERAKAGASEEDCFHLDYALGKAREDAGHYAAAFGHYAQGAARRRESLVYDPDEATVHVRRCATVFTPAFFAERQGWGSPAPDPIFVVGLPRSGSTLIEQILASHSQVEGTMELPDIVAMAKRLGGRKRIADPSAYPEVLRDLDREAVRELGEEYLARTRVHRKSGRPFFVDKMPNNFAHVGFIRLILPAARIVDARREAMACCFSCFKQHFARGQAFTYDLTDLGRYYRDYVALMAGFEAAAPGAVHRVTHEALVADPEGEIRGLLAFCGLGFEAGCLAFHANARAVRTASSEQVRRPINAEGLDRWRAFEPWLEPLRAALGANPPP